MHDLKMRPSRKFFINLFVLVCLTNKVYFPLNNEKLHLYCWWYLQTIYNQRTQYLLRHVYVTMISAMCPFYKVLVF